MPVVELEPIIGPLADDAMSYIIDDGMVTVEIPAHLAIWIGDKEIKMSGATTYQGMVPFDRRIRFRAPPGMSDLTVRLETRLLHNRRYEETLIVERGG